MKTRTEVLHFLTAHTGAPQNLIKGAINEQFNMEADGDARDLCWVMTDHENPHCIPCEVDAAEAIQVWETLKPMLRFGKGGIYLDGELQFDMNGDYI